MKLPQASSRTESMHLVVDATGLKLYGEGEWKVRQHGKEQRRIIRKFIELEMAETGEKARKTLGMEKLTWETIVPALPIPEGNKNEN